MSESGSLDIFSEAILKQRFNAGLQRADFVANMYPDKEALMASNYVDRVVKDIVEGGEFPAFLTSKQPLVNGTSAEVLRLYFKSDKPDSTLIKLGDDVVKNIVLGVSLEYNVSVERIKKAAQFCMKALTQT